MLKCVMNYTFVEGDFDRALSRSGEQILAEIVMGITPMPEFANETICIVQVSANPFDVEETLNVICGRINLDENGIITDDCKEIFIKGIGMDPESDEFKELSVEYEEVFGWKPSQDEFDSIIGLFLRKDCLIFMMDVLENGMGNLIQPDYKSFLIDDEEITEIRDDALKGLMDRDPKEAIPSLAGKSIIIVGVGYVELGEGKIKLMHSFISLVFELDEDGLPCEKDIAKHKKLESLSREADSEDERQAIYDSWATVLSRDQVNKIMMLGFGREATEEDYEMALKSNEAGKND